MQDLNPALQALHAAQFIVDCISLDIVLAKPETGTGEVAGYGLVQQVLYGGGRVGSNFRCHSPGASTWFAITVVEDTLLTHTLFALGYTYTLTTVAGQAGGAGGAIGTTPILVPDQRRPAHAAAAPSRHVVTALAAVGSVQKMPPPQACSADRTKR